MPAQLPGHLQQGFQKAQQAVSLRSQHESLVAADRPADEDLLAAYLAYIKYEEVRGSDTLSVQIIVLIHPSDLAQHAAS